MKPPRLLLFAAVVASLSMTAAAQTVVTLGDTDGTFTYMATTNTLDLGITSDGGGHPDPGMLTSLQGLGPFGVPDEFGANLGSLTLMTGTVATGSISATGGSATFNPGGMFTASYMNGVIFSGSFSSASWTQQTVGGVLVDTWVFSGIIMNGTLTIPLSGGGTETITGINGATVQLTTDGTPGTNHPGGRVTFKDSGGNSNFSISPEPGTLALFGSGLIVVGILARRRLGKENS